MGRDWNEDEAEHPVLSWKLVIAALLHFIVPAYILTLLVEWLAEAPTRGLPGQILAMSARFLVGYAVLALLAAMLARALDPMLRRRRARREAVDPARAERRSAERVATAIAKVSRLISGAIGEPLVATVARLRHGGWDHADQRDRALSADLARAVDAFARAHASAARDDKQEVATLAAAALTRIADALDELADERRRLDHGDALTHARYLDARYGPALDSAGTGAG